MRPTTKKITSTNDSNYEGSARHGTHKSTPADQAGIVYPPAAVKDSPTDNRTKVYGLMLGFMCAYFLTHKET